MANLCSACAQIRFLDLCCPTAPDIHSARKAQKANLKYFKAPPFRVFSAEHSPPDQIVPLGSLGQIRRSSTQCSLCYLIHRVIRHRGAYILGNRPIQDDDDNIIFFAITGILASYGNVTESMSDTTANGCPDKLFDFRRLCLTVHFKEDTVFEGIFVEHYRALAFYNHIAQVCHVDSFEGDSGAKLLIGNTASEFENPRMLFSGRKRPDTVDIKLLRNWMSICNTEHTASCCEESESEDIITPCKLIRLIHVDHLCLHVLRDVDLGDLQYAALSYVWGGPQPVILEKGNEDHFQRKDALSGTDLPQTILDAIHLARLLQIKYLWVDALCIFQGGSPSEIEDRQYQLSNMGNIYRAALVTIIAACGANSNAGLSGLRPGSRSFVQEIVQLVPSDDDSVHAGLGLVTTCTARPAWTGWGQDQDSFHDDIDISAWNTRAWTFQERCLARRSLVFTPEQVFWVCDEAFFCEESSFEDPKLYKKGSFDMPLHVELYGSRFHPLAWKTIDGPLAQMTTTRQNFWTRYSLIVQEYSSRKLTCPGDIFDAFEKIEEAFHRISGETFQWGHPKSRFGVSLAWTSPSYIYTLLRRSATTTLPMTSLKKTVVLPSWSWMGWMGVINLGATDERLECETSDIKIFEHYSYPLHIVPVVGSNRFESQASGYGSLKDWSPDIPLPPYRQKTSKIDVSWDDIQSHLPDITEAKLHGTPDGHILFFWASSAFFTVEPPANLDIDMKMLSMRENAAERKPRVLNAQGTAVGTLDRMGKEHWADCQTACSREQFVVVVRRAFPQLPDIPAVVLALQIRWEDGVAYRVNIAEIDEGAWMEATPEWKLIALM